MANGVNVFRGTLGTGTCPEDMTALRDSVASLAAKFGRGYYQEVVREGRRPTELWEALGNNGFLGAHIPEQYGGGGGGARELNAIIEEVSAQGCPLLSLVVNSIAAPIIAKHGSEELKQRWLPGIASGESKIAFAVTEPDAGLNTYNITTSVTEGPDGVLLLSGQKYWTSAIDDADAVLVVAKDSGQSTSARASLSLFVVPTDALGLSFHPIDSVLETPENQFTVFFDDVRVDADAVVGTRGSALAAIFSGLNCERIAAAAINNGISRYALEKASDYAVSRSVWSQPIGSHQGISHPLAEAYIEVQLARAMTAQAAEVYDAGGDAGEMANIAKYAAAEASLRALDRAIQTHGGNGFSREYGLADLWFIARLHRTAPVSREMILNFISQNKLGLPRSY